MTPEHQYGWVAVTPLFNGGGLRMSPIHFNRRCAYIAVAQRNPDTRVLHARLEGFSRNPLLAMLRPCKICGGPLPSKTTEAADKSPVSVDPAARNHRLP